jgi:hypothetical protein
MKRPACPAHHDLTGNGVDLEVDCANDKIPCTPVLKRHRSNECASFSRRTKIKTHDMHQYVRDLREPLTQNGTTRPCPPYTSVRPQSRTGRWTSGATQTYAARSARSRRQPASRQFHDPFRTQDPLDIPLGVHESPALDLQSSLLPSCAQRVFTLSFHDFALPYAGSPAHISAGPR